MKWIGQNVYDFISRFRNDVYLESISSGTIASGGNLGLDSNNKIVKATVSSSSGDITSVVAGVGLSGGASTGDATLTIDFSEFSDVTPVNGDKLATLDSDGSTEQLTTIADLATLYAGTGLTASSSVINVDAAQPGITSLGTLTGLTLDGNKSVTPGDGAMIHVDASDITDSNTSASGTAAKYAHVNIEPPRLFATNSSVTTTDAATLYINGAPAAGTNQTITNAYALWVDSGNARFDGSYSQTAGDMTLYDAVNDGNPTISLGSSQAERLEIKANYESGAQGLDSVSFKTFTAGSATNDGRFIFYVDEVNTFQIKDSLINIMASGKLTIGNVDILSDSSGTTTLNNIDALDATTEATIESAIDTLSNLTTVGTIGTGVWQGTAINQTYLAGQSGTNTGDETLASVNALDITEVGTIDSGVWQGTAIASAYLDADTAHYSATRQVTHHMITDDIDSDVIYISLLDSDSETSTATNKQLPFIAPTAGKLLKIFLRTSVDYSSETFTWKLYTRNVSSGTGGAPSEIGAQSGAGPTNKTMVTYDFTSSLDSGTNAIAAGDKVQISIEAGDGATANGNYFITCLWEWDLS
jgi:hypothetical protein